MVDLELKEKLKQLYFTLQAYLLLSAVIPFLNLIYGEVSPFLTLPVYILFFNPFLFPNTLLTVCHLLSVKS